MNSLSRVALDLMTDQFFDSLAYSLLDFDTQGFESFCIVCNERGVPAIYDELPVYFDLASLTKPLTLASVFHRNSELFSEREHRLLEHRAGLPSGGCLSRSHWRDELLRFEIKASKTLYSDYSALRLMLELEKAAGKSLREICDFYWDGELCFWRELPPRGVSPVTGHRKGRMIGREVNDPNAWNLGEFCSHAGLFSTVRGLTQSLFNLEQETRFIEQMKKSFDTFDRTRRFLHGWDTVCEQNSLAGEGCGNKTFGHLGFTGTSVWIDSEKRKGQILLTNGCYPWQYARSGLNDLRRKLGAAGWAEEICTNG